VLRAHDLDLIFLVAPTSTDARLQMVTGLVALTMLSHALALPAHARAPRGSQLVNRVRVFRSPVAVGLHSTAEQVADVWRYADAAVVGSASSLY
jgi:tryptophan synthase alpha chain